MRATVCESYLGESTLGENTIRNCQHRRFIRSNLLQCNDDDHGSRCPDGNSSGQRRRRRDDNMRIAHVCVRVVLCLGGHPRQIKAIWGHTQKQAGWIRELRQTHINKQVLPQAPSPTMTSFRRISAMMCACVGVRVLKWKNDDDDGASEQDETGGIDAGKGGRRFGWSGGVMEQDCRGEERGRRKRLAGWLAGLAGWPCCRYLGKSWAALGRWDAGRTSEGAGGGLT